MTHEPKDQPLRLIPLIKCSIDNGGSYERKGVLDHNNFKVQKSDAVLAFGTEQERQGFLPGILISRALQSASSIVRHELQML